MAELRRAMFAAHPHLARVDEIAPGNAGDIESVAQLGGTPDNSPFHSLVMDFYLTNPIARASAVMAECSALARGSVALTAAE
jgi:NADH-quinone oxidoreductase subunit G